MLYYPKMYDPAGVNGKTWSNERYPNKVMDASMSKICMIQSSPVLGWLGAVVYTRFLSNGGTVHTHHCIERKTCLYLLFCNEDLRHCTADSMSDVSDFLGLPSFDFNDAVNAGLYM